MTSHKTTSLSDIRCNCGKLLARKLSSDIVELKCKRCHRRVELSIRGLSDEPVEIDITHN